MKKKEYSLSKDMQKIGIALWCCLIIGTILFITTVIVFECFIK